MRRHSCFLALAALLAFDTAASAQAIHASDNAQATGQKKPVVAQPVRRPQGPTRFYLNVNGGYQATANRFSNTWSFDYYADTGSASATYPVKAGFLADVGGGFRLRGNLFVGAAVSYYTRNESVGVTASVPHPFFYEMRSAEGTGSGLGRNETALHLHAKWMLRARGKFEVGLFGGPSLFKVQQVLATIPYFSEAYPYDTVTFSSVKTERQSKTAAGVNLGADITYGLSRNVGVGVLVRFARGNAALQSADKKSLSVSAGGAQVGAGLRVRF